MRRAVRLLLFLGPWFLFVGPHVLWGRPPVSEIPVDAFFDDVTGVIIVAAGLIVWDRRPGSHVGPLLIVAGYLWYAGSIYQFVPVDSPLQYVSTILRGYYEPILAFVILAFPGDRLERRTDRLAVTFVAAALVGRSVWRLIGIHPGFLLPPEAAANPFRLVTDGDVFAFVDQASFLVLGLALLVVAVLAIQRRGRLRVGGRRVSDPVLLGGAAYAAASGLYTMATFLHPQMGIDIVPWDGPGWTAQYLFRTLAPIGLLLGSLRLRRGAAAVVELMAGPGGPPDRSRLQISLRRALDDPSLVLLYPGAEGWVDSTGTPTSLPDPDGERTVTTIQADGRVSGALVHDATLLDDPALITTVAATLRLAIDNERLRSDLLEQLEEVRASRARVVDAAVTERRRLERDLHDGAQQRLVGLAVSLRTIKGRLGPEVLPSVAAELDAASGEVQAAIDELRELARGLDPAILREAGLGAALESLAGRSPVPVTLEVQLRGRLPARVETAAYFVASEALTNVAKHSDATGATVSAARIGDHLRLTIADDGTGRADPSGAGLRGLADRVAAVDGTFRVVNPLGGGTLVEASIPCES